MKSSFGKLGFLLETDLSETFSNIRVEFHCVITSWVHICLYALDRWVLQKLWLVPTNHLLLACILFTTLFCGSYLLNAYK